VSSPPDQAIFDSGLAAFHLAVCGKAFTAGWKEGLRTSWPWWRPWGVELARVRVPVAVWHGEQDPGVPTPPEGGEPASEHP
jgi:pimeloyl-ACP methyl ester carboxylesterase